MARKNKPNRNRPNNNRPSNNRPSNNRPAPSRPSGASQATLQAFAASNPNSRTAAAMGGGAGGGTSGAGGSASGAGRTTPEVKGARQAMRIAGGDGGITRQEMNTIMDTSGKNAGKFIQNLDKVNANLKAKGKTGINLRGGAANMLIKDANKNRTNFVGRRDFDFGSGRLGTQLSDMSGLNTPINIPNRKVFNSLDWSSEPLRPGERAPANSGRVRDVMSERLPRGMDLMPSGRQTVRGFGKQYEVPERFNPPGEETAPEETPDTTPEEVIEEPVTPEPEPEEEQDRSASSGAGGLDLASWATGFKKARSARQRAGRQAQGLSSQKKSPFKSWKS